MIKHDTTSKPMISLVQPQFVTTTQFVKINATYHNKSRYMSQLTQNITILMQNVTTQNITQISIFAQHVTRFCPERFCPE